MSALAELKSTSEKKSGASEKARPKPPGFSVGITVLTFLLLYIPLIAVAILSFRAPDQTWTLDWYVKAFQDEALRSSLFLSLWVGLGSTVGAAAIGTMAALALERTQFKGKTLFDALNLVPLIMPEIVLGLSLLIWFVFLKVALGSFSIILAHITFCLSFVIITVRARLHDFDMSLEEAARDLGATPTQTFWRVTFPIIWPGILSGALLAFTLSFDDFLIAYFTAGVGSDTLPVKLYSMIKFGLNPTINAMSTLIVAATALLVVFCMRPKR